MATRTSGGLVGEWNNVASSLASWLERLEEYFILEEITEESGARKMVACLLSFIGERGYEILKALTSPEKPSSKTYKQLIKILKEHISPKPVVMVERHKFHRVRQGSKNITEYLADLRLAAEHCEFGDFYNDALRDQFICGLTDERSRKALLSDDNELTLDQAFRKAVAREQAGTNSRLVGTGGTSDTNAVYSRNNTHTRGGRGQASRYQQRGDYYQQRGAGGGQQQRGGYTQRGGDDSEKCKWCKLLIKTNRCKPNKCATSCFKCKKQGHQKKFCKNETSTHNVETSETFTADNDESYNDMYHVESFLDSSNNHIDSKPMLKLTVNSCPVNMELDTGSQLTIVSKQVLQNIPNIILYESQRVIRVANGEYISNVSECRVGVKFNGCEYQLVLHCVEGTFPSLLGRDWIRTIFGQDWLSSLVSQQVKGLKLKGGVHRSDPVKVSGVYASEAEVSDSTAEFVKKVRQSEVFQPGLGLVKDFEAKLHVKEGARPVFRKSRTLAYSVREPVDDHLRKQVADGIMRKVEHCEYASPIVTANKPDGGFRICGDYKHTVNPLLDTTQYPLPTEEECFYPLRGGKKFTKLDIRQAYNQIKLGDDARELLTLNTPLGLLQPTRLPFGVSSATAIFQEVVDKVLQGVPMTVCRVDDICITGKTEMEHRANVIEVVRRLKDAGFKCRLDKCEFYVDEVTYLGHRLNSQGVFPIQSKVETIKKAPYPENVGQLISFLGAVNYYGKFIKNLSSICEPLNRLRGKGVQWQFGQEEKSAFNLLKDALSSDTLLIQYNPSLPVKIDTDASKAGLGAVISHIMPDGSERPIEFSSRSLNKAEKNYGQIEKEALSLVWGVKKFHRYVYARSFELVTDHKPLLFLLGEHKQIPEMGVSRIQRWAVLLASYQYKLKFRSTLNHCNADMCSRFYLQDLDYAGFYDQEYEDWSGVQVSSVFLTTFEDKPLINYNMISRFTRTDPVLSKVVKSVQEGWMPSLNSPELQPYHQRKDELTVEQNCLLWGSRVIVPVKLRHDVLELIHSGHPGIVSMKALSRAYVWWPKLNEAIEQLGRHCGTCQVNQKMPKKTTPHPWVPPSQSWERIHIDFAQWHNRQWLIVVDAYSRFPEIIDMGHNTTSGVTIRELRKLFSVHGLPKLVCSDNGTQLVSEEIEEFYRSNGVEHVRIPPWTPYCNGLAERMVGTFKDHMTKMYASNKDYTRNLACWLLTYRNTPHSVTNQCPSTLMFGRPTRTRLSLLYPSRSLARKQEQVHLDNASYREFKVGDKVYYRDIRKQSWCTGVVQVREGSKVYVLQTDGGDVRKHVDQLRIRYPEEKSEKTTEMSLFIPENNIVPENSNMPVIVPENTAVTSRTEPKTGIEQDINQEESTGVDRRSVSQGGTDSRPVVHPDTSTLPVISNLKPQPKRSSRVKTAVKPLKYSKLGG